MYDTRCGHCTWHSDETAVLRMSIDYRSHQKIIAFDEISKGEIHHVIWMGCATYQPEERLSHANKRGIMGHSSGESIKGQRLPARKL